jgi:xanthine dehydrogenase accessory factor
MPGIYSQLAQLIEANKPAAMATVVAGDRLGAKVLVSAAGIVAGSIHEAIDGKIAADALELLASEESETISYQIGDEQVEVFIETFPPPQRLVIVGAVHVAIPLHRLAKMLGYHVTVVDARGVLATPERFPVADSLLVEWPDDAMASLGLDSSTSVVVLTHDPKFDNPALMAALSSPVRYIGAIGSRTTNSQRRETLRELGATDEQLQRIFAPIGLDIGASTPTEIALAVMAEIVAARRGRPGGHLKVTKGSAS